MVGDIRLGGTATTLNDGYRITDGAAYISTCSKETLPTTPVLEPVCEIFREDCASLRVLVQMIAT